jgi:hypothetical protein
MLARLHTSRLRDGTSQSLGTRDDALQENGTGRSWRQSGQRTRANPCARMPHRRKSRSARSTKVALREEGVEVVQNHPVGRLRGRISPLVRRRRGMIASSAHIGSLGQTHAVLR